MSTPLPPAALSETQVLIEELHAFGCADAKAATLAEARAEIDRCQPKRSALCLSGGGIRSASFALGVVQRLAKAGLLKEFDYLSTVSGGGYLGSLLTAWRRSNGDQLKLIEAELPGQSPVIEHVRRFSNFLTPQFGLTSADSWALVATVARNLLLNWTVLVTTLAIVLTIPWAAPLGVMAAMADWVRTGLLGLAFVCFALGTAYPALDLPVYADLKLSQSRFVWLWLLPMVGGIVSLCTWWAGTCNSDPGALDWMREHGLRATAIFLIEACGAGVMLSIVVTLCSEQRWKLLVHFSEKARAKAKGVRAQSGKTGEAGWKEGLLPLVLGALAVCVIGAPAAWLLQAVALHVFPDPAQAVARYACFAPPLLLGGFFVLNSLYVGIISRLSGDEDREWWARAMGWVLLVCGAWVGFHALVFYAPCAVGAVDYHKTAKAMLAALGGVGGLVAAFFASSAGSKREPEDAKTLNFSRVLVAVALLFFAVLACGVNRVMEQIMPEPISPAEVMPAKGSRELSAVVAIEADRKVVVKPPPEQEGPGYGDRFLERARFRRFADLTINYKVPDPRYQYAYYGWSLALFFLVAGTVVIGMGAVVNVNRFSLHATYRNRLVRAFLGAARMDGAGKKREPNPFTGFDAADNFPIHLAPMRKLFHVVTMTLNLVHTKNLAWQERMGAAFTASPLHCGSDLLGYRPSKEYGGGLTLGTAMAISGAAANPNQGYHSSPVLGLLMTLFNVRLGWWLGNPRRPEVWQLEGPEHALRPLLDETFGNTTEDAKHVQLSDGGHFDNMGLYEMVRRRCRLIVLIDGEEDGKATFEGLGQAVRKIRIDQRIEITFTNLGHLAKPTEPTERACFALGRIVYPDQTEGDILYVKPVLRGQEPVDVKNYAAESRTFPHESTGDQFFSESQFESYRALGWHEAESFLPLEPAPKSIAAWFVELKKPAKGTGDGAVKPAPTPPEPPVM